MDEINLKLSMEDCMRITGSLSLLSKVDESDSRLENLKDRIIGQIINRLKENEQKENKKQTCVRCNCPNQNDHEEVCLMDIEDYVECINCE